jgi:hypothetical protein
MNQDDQKQKDIIGKAVFNDLPGSHKKFID